VKGKEFLSSPPSPPPPHAISGLLALIIQEEDPVTRIKPEEEEVLLTNMAAKYQTDQVPTVWYVAVPVYRYPTCVFDEYQYLIPYTLKYTTIPKYLYGMVQVKKFLQKAKFTLSHLLKSTGIDFNLTFFYREVVFLKAVLPDAPTRMIYSGSSRSFLDRTP
jgi:hypothetical protein